MVFRNKIFNFTNRSYIMGILNVTPDSFSDGGKFNHRDRAVARGIELVQHGADIIDIGGESTRPGAAPVSPEEEAERVIPVIRSLAGKVDVPLSVDTTKADVAQKALDAGAEIVNDVSAMRADSNMAKVVSDYNACIIIMHMLGTPLTMQKAIHYESLLDDICCFLQGRISAALAAGIRNDKIIIDPGIGFGKSLEKDNFVILKHLKVFKKFGVPLLVGPSRKAFIARVTGDELDRRDNGTCAAAAIAVCNGADIIRVHNVKAVKDAVMVADAVKRV